MLMEAEFLAIVLVLVYVGAVMVLFMFVVMMLDINLAQLREGFTRYAPLGAVIAIVVIAEIASVVVVKSLGLSSIEPKEVAAVATSNTQELGYLIYTKYLYPFELAAVLLLIAIIAAIVLTMRRREGHKAQDISAQVAVRAKDRVRIIKMPAEKREGSSTNHQDASGETRRFVSWGGSSMITLQEGLMLGGILFALAVAGMFLNRKNVILLLMCIELMLLAVNFNFIAFARHLGNLDGQVFVFFILTVAAAESAIGLAILVVLFRERKSINVETLDTMKG
jgi:NADH-quinone oxidoreductase subunit J